jgi:predicted CopG family antitoxin
MIKKKENKENELSFDDALDRLIELKKNENSALKKIYNSLKDKGKRKS